MVGRERVRLGMAARHAAGRPGTLGRRLYMWIVTGSAHRIVGILLGVERDCQALQVVTRGTLLQARHECSSRLLARYIPPNLGREVMAGHAVEHGLIRHGSQPDARRLGLVAARLPTGLVGRHESMHLHSVTGHAHHLR